MNQHNTSFLDRADRPRIVYHHRRASEARASAPTMVFLPGYASDMTGTKALALDGWAEREGLAMLRFDYAGCGASGGGFEDQGLADWRDDALALIDTVVDGPVLLIGSSMGGWLALLVALARPKRVAGIAGIAAAPDFTMWGFSQEEKITLLTEGRLEKPSDYGPEPMVTTRKFWQSGEGNRVLIGEIAIDCPVRLIQGQNDADVPWQYALETQKQLRSADVQLLLIKDGDHRLSRDTDIALLIQTVGNLLGSLAEA
ncbi:alpha/beta hydrolase [Blastomonas aquatica]|uniref:Palmitoyl-protein thioesterase ABHD10, mitochondrial n=1 Tax=Blastomonas aquatica TaxID=1510276 RepID=A0ABQ1IWW7_9SPHN|nr:alpha/beta hydrolase [Blastomonas aquatica]GGB54265.1 alpha/beta hydrolase [Blastomonas aquatica]